MTKHTLSDERSFNNTLADYADGLIDHNRKPVLADKSDVEMTGLIKTINDFHSLAISIKADEEVKRTILRNIHDDWERKQQVKDHPIPFWIQTVKSIFERPVLRRVSVLAAVTLFILGIVLMFATRFPEYPGNCGEYKNRIDRLFYLYLLHLH